MSSDVSTSSPLACISYSVAAGLLTTLSVIVVAYPTYLENTGKKSFGPAYKGVFFALSVVLGLGNAGTQLQSLSYGPITLAMPLSSASGLLSNMMFQMLLGMKPYTKSMRVGTLVLGAAVAVLIDVGPRDVTGEMDVVTRLFSTPGVSCLAAQAIMIVIGLVMRPKYRDADPTSLAKIFFTLLVVSNATVLGASCGKAFTAFVDQGSWLKYVAFGLWLPIGGLAMFVDTLAYGQVDVAVYVPMGYCMQLIIACVSGLGIWEDWRVIEEWTAYIMVYSLMVLGIYELSSIDLVRAASVRRFMVSAALSEGMPVTPVGKAILTLQQTWQETPSDEAATSAALQDVLELGLQHSYIMPSELLELTMALAKGHKETGPTGATLAWAEQHVTVYKQYCAADPRFAEAMAATSQSSLMESSSVALASLAPASGRAPAPST